MFATTTTGNVASTGDALGILADRRVMASLQPNLYFEAIADIQMVSQGNDTDRFALFDQIATSSVTSLTEATNPTGIASTVTVKDITPTQYGINVEMSDLVVLTTFFDFVKAGSTEVGFAMARKIDSVIQTTANAGTNVYYGGNATARANVDASDVLDYALLVKAGQKLVKGSAPTFSDGYYRAIGTPEQIYDLKSNTSTGQWVDVSKYAQPQAFLNGEVGAVNKIRIVQSPNVDTFSSTITVHPMLVAGAGGVRVSYWLPGRVKQYLNHPENADVSNPLGQKGSIGTKSNIGVSRTQEARLVRLETAGTAL